MQFRETAECIQRINCFLCRNDARYRAMITHTFGHVPTQEECPLHLPENAPMEAMPEPARKAEKFRAQHAARMAEQRAKAEAFLERLSQLQPELVDDARDLLSFLLSPVAMTKKCKWQKVTDEDTTAPCRGKYIICENPESPIYGQHRVWWEKKCNRAECRFFARMD